MNIDVSRMMVDHLEVLRAIYYYFRAHVDWPTFIAIDRPLRRERGIDTAAIITSMPEGLMVSPRPGKLRPVATDQLRLTVLGIAHTLVAEDDIERFVRLLRWLAEQEMAYEPEPGSSETMPRVTSHDVAVHMRLDDDDLAVARLYGMLQLDNWGLGGNGSGDDGWFVTLGPDIWRFRDVQNIEECVRIRKEWVSEGQANLAHAWGQLEVEPTSSAVVPPTALSQDAIPINNSYVNQRIVDDIRTKDGKSQFNVAKLLRLIEELNENSEHRNSYATHALLRAILDHIPPILGQPDFNGVVNNYSWGRTDKRYLKRLADFRDQADDALHRQISARADLLEFDDIPASVCVNRLLQECATQL